MSPPREHPGNDTSFADAAHLDQLRARVARGRTGTTELTIDDVLGGSLDASAGAPSDAPAAPGASLPDAGPSGEISADELLGWFQPSVDRARAELPDGGPGRPGGDRLPVLADASALAEDLGAPAALRPGGARNRFYRRRFGAAPFVKPSARRSRRKRRRDYRQLGFVELTPEKLRLHHRILPRTVLGASVVLVALGVGAAFSGASFYAYYDWKVSRSEAQSQAFAERFEGTFTGAQEQIDLSRNQAIDEINQALGPLQAWNRDANAVAQLPSKVGAGVFFVRTQDAAGKASVGSAFVISSSPTESLLLTSYQVVAALSARPGPALTLEKGADSFPAELWSWDADLDLALLKTARGNLPQLEWSSDAERAQVAGGRFYAVSGMGGQGATASSGMAVDASQMGLRHDIPMSPEFRGAPITNGEGHVVAVASTTYSPTGIDPGELAYAPFITSACERVVACPSSVTTRAAEAPAAGGATVTTAAATPTSGG